MMEDKPIAPRFEVKVERLNDGVFSVDITETGDLTWSFFTLSKPDTKYIRIGLDHAYNLGYKHAERDAARLYEVFGSPRMPDTAEEDAAAEAMFNEFAETALMMRGQIT